MGEMEVPADALYGASTQRAVLNFPISGPADAAPVPARPGAGQAGGRRDQRRARAARARTSRPRSPRPRPRSPTGGHDDQFPIDIYQTGSGTSTNTNMNEVVAHLAGARLGGREGPSERRRQSLPELERHDPDGAPAVGGDRHRGRAAARPRAAARGARGQGAGVLAGRQDRPDAPPGRDADPARPGVPRLRRAGRGVDPAGARRPGRAARRAARRDRGRDRASTPIRSTRPGLRPTVGADRPGRSARRRTTSTPRRRSTRRSPRTARSGPSR